GSNNNHNSDGDGSRSEGGQRELSPQDFDSLEEYAQALIDKKQSAVSTQQSASDAQSQESGEEDSAQATGDQTEGEQGEHSQGEHPETGFDLEADDLFSPKDLNERISGNPKLRKALETDPALRNAVFSNAR